MASISNTSAGVHNTPFEPWGGFVACNTGQDCFDAVLGAVAEPEMTSCLLVLEGTVKDLPEAKYCACTIMYARTGANCTIRLPIADVFGWLQMIPIAVAVFVAGRILHKVAKAHRGGVLRVDAAGVTVLTCMVCSVLNLSWTVAYGMARFGINAIKIENLSAGLAAAAAGIAMSVCTLVWQEVLHATKRMQTGANKQVISTRSKVLVAVSSAALSCAVVVLIYENNSGAASLVAVSFYVVLAIVYTYNGRKLCSLLESTNSQSPAGRGSARTGQALKRIYKVVRRVQIFTVVFIIIALLYTATSTDQSTSSLTPPILSLLAIKGMMIMICFCVKWIADYAAQPILARLESSTGRSSKATVQPTSMDDK